MFFARIITNIKQRSTATLNAWAYQCESILAQRSRRIQQLFTFYHRVYGTNGLRLIIRSYHHQLRPPIRGMVMSAVGAVGLTVSDVAGSFDWRRKRLSLSNFDACNRDIEFINSIGQNKLCPLCKEKQMKYCFCLVGNKKCRAPGSSEETVRGCRKSLNLHSDVEDGPLMVEAADENPWEPYLSKDQFSIWKREERTEMFSYKVYARFDDISASDLMHVQTDIKYRKQWDQTAVTLQVIEEDPTPGSNSHLIYWEMQWPRLFSNRDYVYCRRFVQDDLRKVMMICSRGTTHPAYPVYSNKVRVTDYWSFMVIKPYRSFTEPGVHYILTYYDDPGLPIPQNIKSWVTQKQMPEFLKKMYTATKTYTCKRAIEMGRFHTFDNFKLFHEEYTANEARDNWLKRAWRKRQNGD